MRLYLLMLPAALALLGCERRPSEHVVYERPIVLHDDRGPVFYEDGMTVRGVVLHEPRGVDYVHTDGGWYYFHPGARVWVHARHDDDWHPDGGHVYRSWTEHPEYRHGR